MRYFNYTKDYSGMNINIKSYIEEMKKELQYLLDIEKLPIYNKAIEVIKHFETKYPNLYTIQRRINNDLISAENINYFYTHNKYKEDASPVGLEFQKDLQIIFNLEEQLKQISIESFKSSITNFENIENGEDFLVVGHSSYQLPGLPGDNKYKYNEYYGKRYISCSLITNNELNTFQQNPIVYLVDINNENYLCGSYYDVSARETSSPSIFTIGETEINGKKVYINAGNNFDSKRFALSIATPRVIEVLSLKRELEQNKEPYNYNELLTNETILNREKTHNKGCLLVAEETRLLFSEFKTLKRNNIKFKCINIGLYKEKQGINRFTPEEIIKLKKELQEQIVTLQNELNQENYIQFLTNYYEEIVIPMKYSDELLSIINTEFSKYININEINNNTNRKL